MLIICPHCSSSYLIRATEIGPSGRLVRCGSCQNSWQVDGSGADPSEIVEDSVQPIVNNIETEAEDNRKVVRSRISPNRRIALGGLAVAAMASVFVMPLGRIAEVARAWIGRVIPADRYAGLDFMNVSSQLVAENDEIFLVVEGQIISKSGEMQTMPGLALSIRGEGNDQIFRWTAKPPAETISTGEPIPFKVRLASPPVTGREVLIRFVDASEVEGASAS